MARASCAQHIGCPNVEQTSSVYDVEQILGENIDLAGVCENTTPPKKTTGGKLSSQNKKSGAAEQFPLLDRKAKARVKGVLVSQTPVLII